MPTFRKVGRTACQADEKGVQSPWGRTKPASVAGRESRPVCLGQVGSRRTVRHEAPETGEGQTFQVKSRDFVLSIRVTLENFKEKRNAL